MAFCQYCGKELSDGEICSCQGSAAQASNIDVKALANGVWGTTKEILADPEEGSKGFVRGISWLNIGIIAAVYAILEIIYGIWDKIEVNIETSNSYKKIAKEYGMKLKDYAKDWGIDLTPYGFGDIMKGVFMDLLHAAAGIAISAVVFFLAVKLIKKISITWREAFAIAVIELIVIVPLTLLNQVLGLIPTFKLLVWIMASITSVRIFASTILTYLGLKGKCGDTRSTLYVAIPAVAVGSIATALVTFLINSLF